MTALRKNAAASAGHSQDEVARVPTYQGDVTKQAVDWLQAKADGDEGFDPEEWEVIEGYVDSQKSRLA